VFSIDRGAYHLRYGPRMCPMGPGSPRKRALRRGHTWTCIDPELSMGWFDPWVGLGRVELGRDISVFGGLGWGGSTVAEVVNFDRIMIMHLKNG